MQALIDCEFGEAADDQCAGAAFLPAFRDIDRLHPFDGMAAESLGLSEVFLAHFRESCLSFNGICGASEFDFHDVGLFDFH
jgi:hypothetical protein